jgi:hypothetical protein
MSWQSLITDKSPVWAGVVQYAEERMAELAATCCDQSKSDAEIRAAQAGREELRLLLALPGKLAITAELSKGKSRREY